MEIVAGETFRGYLNRRACLVGSFMTPTDTFLSFPAAVRGRRARRRGGSWVVADDAFGKRHTCQRACSAKSSVVLAGTLPHFLLAVRYGWRRPGAGVGVTAYESLLGLSNRQARRVMAPVAPTAVLLHFFSAIIYGM